MRIRSLSLVVLIMASGLPFTALARTKGSEAGSQAGEHTKQMCVDMVAAKKVQSNAVAQELTKCLSDPTVYK